jgi:hypothetical protein
MKNSLSLAADSGVAGAQILHLGIVKDGKATHIATTLRGRRAGTGRQKETSLFTTYWFKST